MMILKNRPIKAQEIIGILWILLVFASFGIVLLEEYVPEWARYLNDLNWVGWIVIISAFWFLCFLLKKGDKIFTLFYFHHREPLVPQEIYTRYFGSEYGSFEELWELWTEVAEAFDIPAEKLRPTDRFGYELGGFWEHLEEEKLGMLQEKMQVRMLKDQLAIDVHAIRTVDDYIQSFAAKNKPSA